MNNKEKRRIEIYSLMDSFLTETDKPRSITQLNEDRHLFYERMSEHIDREILETIEKETTKCDGMVKLAKQELLSAIEAEVEKSEKTLNKERLSNITRTYTSYDQAEDNGYHHCVSDIQALLKSAKNK